MTTRIDLNADLGEGCDFDSELMSVVTSCNIACGGHAGDNASMSEALALAKDNQVAAGAHPSFPDRENFGRTPMNIRGSELEEALRSQIESLNYAASAQDVSLTHIKPHGALYNMAARDADLSESILNVLQTTLPQARLVGPPDSDMQRAAAARGVRYTAEGFADRAYESDGQLRDRRKTGAVIHDPTNQAQQAESMAIERHVKTFDGETIALPVDSICVHGDTPEAFAAARAIRDRLANLGLELCSPR